MSIALEEVLANRQDARSTSGQIRPDMGYDARSFAEFRAAHQSEPLNVAPQQFDMGTPYPTQEAPRAPYGYGMQQGAPQGYNDPAGYGYAERPMGRGMTQNFQTMNYTQGAGNQPPTYDVAQTYAPHSNWQPMPFYGYVAREDSERQNEYESKLSSSANYAREQQRYEERFEEPKKPKMKRRLNAKGAIILSLYLAVVAVVITLIGVNAGKINSGKAVVPAGQVSTQTEQAL